MVNHVRPADRTDSRFIARIMYESMLPGVGRGIFDDALRDTDVDPISFGEVLILEGANNWGQLQDFVVVEVAGQPAGACAAYRSNLADLRPLTGEGFERVRKRLGWPPEVARSFWRSYVRLFGLFGNSPQLQQPADYVAEYLAVLDSYRGQGLASALLQAHAERASAEGCETLGISAMFGNEPALRSYEKFGFREECRLGPERYGGAFPGMIRMVLKL